MRRRRVPRIERILRRINRLIPTFQHAVAQHPLDHRSSHLRQLQELRQRQWPALRLQQFADSFFCALPLCTPRLRVIFSFDLFFRRLFSRRSAALPSDHPLRPSISALHRLANFNESAPLQPLQRGSVNSQLCCWTKQQSSFLLFQLRERRRLRGGESMQQFTAAQAPRGFTSCIGQNNLALRFQLRHRRQHRAENFANRCQVVRRDPMRQLDLLRRQRGNKIQYAGDLANFRSLRRALRHFHDDSDHRFLAERHEHAAARLHRSLQCFRNCIGKRGAQRHRQRDIAKWRSHPVV